MALQRGHVVTGYPLGPVNWPMYGGFTYRHPKYCAGPCRPAWFNQSKGSFWFGHKMPPHWMRELSMGDLLRTVNAKTREMARTQMLQVASKFRLNGFSCVKPASEFVHLFTAPAGS